MAGTSRYQTTRYGQGFGGPGHRWLRAAIGIGKLKLRGTPGPFTIDDPENPNDGHTKRTRKETWTKVRERLANAQPGLRLVIRGKHYDDPAVAIRKVDVAIPAPMVEAAKVYLHDRYKLGEVPPPLADCSGLTLKCAMVVYHIELPHQALQQANDPHVQVFHDPSLLDPDDFIFYVYGRLGSQIDHVAINVNGRTEIGARPSLGGVEVGSIDWPNVVSFGRLKI